MDPLPGGGSHYVRVAPGILVIFSIAYTLKSRGSGGMLTLEIFENYRF